MDALRRWSSRPVLRAVAVFGFAALVLALVAALGGFRAAPAVGTTRYAVGSTVTLARWRVVVERAELTNTDSFGSKAPTALRISLRLTWTGSRSTPGPTTGLIALVVPGGPAPDPEASDDPAGGYEGGFDPEVQRPLVLDYTWPPQTGPQRSDGSRAQPPVPGVPKRVDLVLSDEYPRPTYLDNDSWSLTGPVGHVELPVRDARR